MSPSRSIERVQGASFPSENVSSCFIIISEVFRKNSPKVLFAENDQMISALAPGRPNQAFNIAILPGRTERGRPVSDTHRPYP